jgi:hypothetical protein
MWRRRLGGLGSDDRALRILDRAIAVIEERVLWGRFGL